MRAVETADQHTLAASDVELVRAARAQDDSAFEELYRRYHGLVAGYVRRHVRDQGRAEEVAQEAFVSALRRIRQTDSEIHFKPWIYQIARNASIDHHRRRSSAEEVPIDLDGGRAPFDPLSLAASTTPEAAVIDRERFEHFRGALDELSETQRRIITLRELEGLSYRDVGARMQLSPAAVESALFRARRKLEEEYEQLESGRRCTLILTLMARLAEGVESRGDRRRLDRHARRCWSCRRHACRLGLRPQRASGRAVAVLPLPAFLRRLLHGADPAVTGGREATGLAGAPAFETAAEGAHRAVVVLVSAIAIGGGGATLGGIGPLAVKSGHPAAASGKAREASSKGRARGTSGEQRSAASPASSRRKRAGGPRHAGGHKPSEDGRAGSEGPPVAPSDSRSAPPRSALPGLPALPGVAPRGGGGAPVSLPRGAAPASGPVLPPAPALPPAPTLPRPPKLPALPVDAGINTSLGEALVPEGLSGTGQPGGVAPAG